MMKQWLDFTDEQRRAILDSLANIAGINQKAAEKDWWVTITLKALFQGPFASHMVFKGGTSLSKCWNSIERFSEDVDIALSPEAFGMTYEQAPSKSFVKRLKRAGCEFTSTVLKRDLAQQLATLGVPDGSVRIVADDIRVDMPDTDPQTLRVLYPSLFEPHPYFADEVKIEVSVRSLQTPFSAANVQSIISEKGGAVAYNEMPFSINAVDPRKTFIEKLFLLQEEFNKPNATRIRSKRMSRHLYDLGCMAGTEIEARALADHALYEQIIRHREMYSNISWMKYDTLRQSTISFIPPPSVIDSYREDYKIMQAQMIHGESLSFEALIQRLQQLQERVWASGRYASFSLKS